jgi:hypothetical protein
MTESSDTTAFSITDEELALAREFNEDPEMTAKGYKRKIVLALSFSGIENPTDEQLMQAKAQLVEGMRAEIESA